MPLSAADVAEIARLLEESDFEELHVEQDGLKLTLRRGAAPRREAPGSAAAQPATVPADAGGAPRGGSPAAASGVLEVTAPLVGIFYRAPKPGAAPYVEVGAAVQPDSIIGIIEVMKLMNAVRAEVAGTVVEVLGQDGAVVEYGQVLARVAPGAPGG